MQIGGCERGKPDQKKNWGLSEVQAMGSYHKMIATHVLVLSLFLTACGLNIQPIQKIVSPLAHSF